MTDTTLAVKDGTGASQLLKVQGNQDGSLTPYHLEDTTQRQALIDALSPLATIAGGGAGSTGRDFSGGTRNLPNIGAAFSAGPYAGYVVVATAPANPGRANIDIENASGAQVVVVRDDGTAGSGVAPANGSLWPLGGGVALGAQGASWSSTTFKGRIQIYAPAALAGGAFVTLMED